MYSSYHALRTRRVDQQGVQQLDSGIFRYRVGHYRIIYNVDNDTVTVIILRVKPA